MEWNEVNGNGLFFFFFFGWQQQNKKIRCHLTCFLTNNSFGPPEAVQKAAKEAIDTVESNQYSHPKGRLRLRNAIAASYSPEFNRQLNPETEILVTAGANEGKKENPVLGKIRGIGRRVVFV